MTDSINWQTAFSWLWRCLVGVLTVLTGIVAYQGQQLIERSEETEARVTIIEGTRYTSADAAKDLRGIREALQRIELSRPAWVESRFADLERTVRSHMQGGHALTEQRMQHIERTLEKILDRLESTE